MADPVGSDPNALWSGSIAIGVGAAAVLRIPIPGTQGLCIQFNAPGGYTNSTSVLFFAEDPSSKFGRMLRLDYGPRPATVNGVKVQVIDYHWNQAKTFPTFGIPDHTPAGTVGKSLYQGAKYFRYGARFLGIVGVALDVISIVQADKPLQRATEVVAGWAGAALGCRVVGAGGGAAGFWLGSEFPVVGNAVGAAVGGVGGCVVGGAMGYFAVQEAGRYVYQWAEGTNFMALFPASEKEAIPATTSWGL